MTIEHHGELRLVRPQTQRAYIWLRHNSDTDRTWYEGALVMDAAAVDLLIEHAMREGFVI